MSTSAVEAPSSWVAGEWQRRRAELTHDWLQNRALPHANALLAITNGAVRGDDAAIAAMSAVLSEWRDRRDDVAWLTEHVVEALSPVNVLDGDSAFVFDEQLRVVSERAWICRHRVEETVASIRTIAFDLDRILAALEPFLRRPQHSRLVAAAPALIAFAAAGRALVEAFRSFPRRGAL